MKNFKEAPLSEEEVKEINDKRARVDKLRENDRKKIDSVEVLALEEDEYREVLKEEGVNKVSRDKLGDLYSDKGLEKLEKKKQAIKYKKKAIEHEKASNIDPLTGAYNRRALLKNGIKELSGEKRKGNDAAMIMLDIDDFKAINDTYDHTVGDKILKRVADTIKDSLRASDYFYRYGGEEFVIFLNNTNTEGSKIVAEIIRKNVEKAVTMIKEEKDGKEVKTEVKATISLGCANTKDIEDYSKQQKDIDMEKILEKLIKKADEAMYRSKAHGKNQVTSWDEKTKDKE